jgi:hypothetical protein
MVAAISFVITPIAVRSFHFGYGIIIHPFLAISQDFMSQFIEFIFSRCFADC